MNDVINSSGAASLDFDLTFDHASAAAGYCPVIPWRSAQAGVAPSAATAPTRADPNAKAVDIDLGIGEASYAYSLLTRQDLANEGLPVPSCVISAHGNPDGIFINNETPIFLFKLARDITTKCPPDEPVVLLSCETGRPKTDGTSPVAQLLAQALKNEGRQNTTVWAPNTKVGANFVPPLPFVDPDPFILLKPVPTTFPHTPFIVWMPRFIPYHVK